jgi:hypothetical protein
MLRTRVFISHSSSGDEEVRSLLDKVVDELKTVLGYEVQIDFKEIRTGDDWREKIHSFLQTCDAAAVLFSPKAMGSAWVLKEATILAYLRSRNPAFPLTPILLPGVGTEEFKAKTWSPVYLDEKQFFRSKDPIEIAREIARMAGPAARTFGPVDAARARVVATLARVPCPILESSCRRSAASILQPPAENPTSYYASLLGRQLIEDSSVSMKGVVNQLGPLLLNAAEAREIVNHLAPLWVDAEEASRITATAQPARADLHLAFQGEMLSGFTIPRYLTRAYPDRPDVSRRVVPVDASAAEGLVQEVHRALEGWISGGPYRLLLKRNPLSQVLQSIREQGGPVFVLLPVVPSADVVKNLRTVYPDVTFLLSLPASEEGTPDAVSAIEATLPDRVRLANPSLTLKGEEQLYTSDGVAEDYCRSLEH